MKWSRPLVSQSHEPGLPVNHHHLYRSGVLGGGREGEIVKNTPKATEAYQKARRAIKRLDTSTRPDQTALTICKHLKDAIKADGEQK